MLGCVLDVSVWCLLLTTWLLVLCETLVLQKEAISWLTLFVHNVLTTFRPLPRYTVCAILDCLTKKPDMGFKKEIKNSQGITRVILTKQFNLILRTTSCQQPIRKEKLFLTVTFFHCKQG